MNTAISLTSLHQNGTKICCICLENKSVDIPLINCDHRCEFCHECISQWLELKKFDCPICRKVWQEKDCVSRRRSVWEMHFVSSSPKPRVKMVVIWLCHWNLSPPQWLKMLILRRLPISVSSIQLSTHHQHELVGKCTAPWFVIYVRFSLSLLFTQFWYCSARSLSIKSN